jgi:hypothetical protein
VTLTTTACSFEINPVCGSYYTNGTILYYSPGAPGAAYYACARCATDGDYCYCACNGYGSYTYDCATQTSFSDDCSGTGCSSDCYNACCAYAECSTGKKNLFCQLNACIAAFRTSNRMFFVMSHVKKSNVTSDKILSDLMHIRLLCMILT